MNVAAVAIAIFLAVLPLLPSGPEYFGRNAAYSVDAAVAMLVVLWLLVRVAGTRGTPRPSTGTAVFCAWLVLIAAITGALFVALALEIRLGSPVFAEHMAGMPWRILEPLDFVDDPFYPARIWLTFIEGFLTFAIIRDCCRRSESPRQFARIATWGLLAGLAVVSILAIGQYLTRFQLDPTWAARNPLVVRAHATFDDPNALAAYLILCTGLAAGVALSETRRSHAIAAIVIAVLASAAVLATGSRSGLIALPAAVLIVIGFAPRPSPLPVAARTMARRLLAVTAIAGVVLLATRFVVDQRLAPLPTSLIDATVQTFDPRVDANQVLQGRLTFWSAALQIARGQPLSGLGLGRYPREAPNFLVEWMPNENAHNLFLQMLAETGLAGFLAFATLWAVVLQALWRGAASDGADAGLMWGALLGTLAFGLTLLTGHALLVPSGQVMLGSVAALAGVRLPQEAAFDARSMKRIAFGVSLVVLGMYSVMAWRMPSPPWVGDPWGYSWGLTREERGFFPAAWNLPLPNGDLAPGPPGTSAAAFKWTGPRAALELEVTPDHTKCVLPYAAPLPFHVKGAHQSVTFRHGITQQTLDVADAGLHFVELPLTRALLDRGRWLLVRIDVYPTFRPASIMESFDQRDLGIMLFRPRCE